MTGGDVGEVVARQVDVYRQVSDGGTQVGARRIGGIVGDGGRIVLSQDGVLCGVVQHRVGDGGGGGMGVVSDVNRVVSRRDGGTQVEAGMSGGDVGDVVASQVHVYRQVGDGGTQVSAGVTGGDVGEVAFHQDSVP